MERKIVIGDVHGMRDLLVSLMNELDPKAGDTIIFVGDLLDKGPDPAGVVKMVRQMDEKALFKVILVEGNHEDLHRRYRRNLVERPNVAEQQAARIPELPMTTELLAKEDILFLEAAVPFYQIPDTDKLVVHGGIPATMRRFPVTVDEAQLLKGKERKTFLKILRTRYVSAIDRSFLVAGEEGPDDPFWAEVYDGRFGHVIFGHEPMMDGPRIYPFATGIDTGAVFGGALTAMIIEGGRTPYFVSVG